MKTVIVTLALVLLAEGPTFAASSHSKRFQEGRNFYVPQSTYVPQSGQFSGADTSRESLIRAN
jgi:hypothetical protein